MKFVIFREHSDRRDWRWKLVARNGRSIAVSGEGYKRKRDARNGAELVKAYASEAPILEGK